MISGIRSRTSLSYTLRVTWSPHREPGQIARVGRLTRVDEATVLAEAQQVADPIGPAAAEAFWQTGGPSTELMRSDRL